MEGKPSEESLKIKTKPPSLAVRVLIRKVITITILYNRIMTANHSLIAGASGSGKSVAINGALCYAYANYPSQFELILIDLKRVELIEYRSTSQCVFYADNVSDALTGINMGIQEIERRYTEMQAFGQRQSTRKILYIVIDEMADLVLTVKGADKLIQRIGQLGRACNVKLICATQCPLAKVIPTAIKVNFDCIVGLRTRSKQDSRNILGIAGCEQLPRFGKCIIDLPDLMQPALLDVPNCTIDKVKHYCGQNQRQITNKKLKKTIDKCTKFVYNIKHRDEEHLKERNLKK